MYVISLATIMQKYCLSFEISYAFACFNGSAQEDIHGLSKLQVEVMHSRLSGEETKT